MNREILYKRLEVTRARQMYDKLRVELLSMEQERARVGLTRLPAHQRKVLDALSDGYWSEYTPYSYLRTIEADTGLTREQVRRALRGLRRYGFTEYGKGLWTEDGEPAGSGWRATRLGDEWMERERGKP